MILRRAVMELPELTELDREVDQLLRQVAALAETEIGPAAFYEQLLTRAVFGLAAAGGTAWLMAPGGPQRLASHPADAHPTCAASAGLLSLALERRSLLVPPGFIDPAGGFVNDTPWLLVIAAVRSGGHPVALLEIRQRPQTSDAARQGYARFVEALCELAGGYHQRLEQRRWQARAQFARELDSLAVAVHGSLDLSATATAIANEGRRLIDADRLTVLVAHGLRAKAMATSGVDVLDRRAAAVAAIEGLAAALLATDEDLHAPDDVAERLPQVDAALARALDAGGARALSALVLRPETPGADRPAGGLGVLVAEWFRQPDDLEGSRERMQAIARHASAALTNALTFEAVPLARWLAPWGQRPGQKPARRGRRVLLGAVAAAVAAALAFVPADFRLHATGELWPRERKNVFAATGGVVQQVHVQHGQQVSAGEVLVTLRDPRLEFELSRVQGELETARKRLASIRAERAGVLPEADDALARFHQRTAEEEEVKASLATLEKQLALLRGQERELSVRAPIGGVVLTWQPDQLLAGRPVERGQLLLRVADAAGPWIVEAQLPDDLAGDLQAARQRGPQDLPVSLALLTDPTTSYRGRVAEVADVIELDAADQPTLRLTVALDQPPREPRCGSSVLVRIDCGRRRWGYVLFHDAVRAAAGWLY